MLTKKNPTLADINIKARNILANPLMRPKITAERKDDSYLFTHDLSSDLTNYYLITEQLEKNLQAAKDKNQVLAVFYLTLNGFKQIRNIYGHSISDKARSIIVKRLKQVLDVNVHLSHLNDNEYIASLVAEKNQIEIVDKIMKNIEIFSSRPISIEGFTIKVGIRVGTAVYPIHGDKVGVLLDIAEKRSFPVKSAI